MQIFFVEKEWQRTSLEEKKQYSSRFFTGRTESSARVAFLAEWAVAGMWPTPVESVMGSWRKRQKNRRVRWGWGPRELYRPNERHCRVSLHIISVGAHFRYFFCHSLIVIPHLTDTWGKYSQAWTSSEYCISLHHHVNEISEDWISQLDFLLTDQWTEIDGKTDRFRVQPKCPQLAHHVVHVCLSKWKILVHQARENKPET